MLSPQSGIRLLPDYQTQLTLNWRHLPQPISLYKLAVYMWDEVHWDKRKECAPAKGGGQSITECISGPARMTSVSGLGCAVEVGRSRDS